MKYKMVRPVNRFYSPIIKFTNHLQTVKGGNKILGLPAEKKYHLNIGK